MKEKKRKYVVFGQRPIDTRPILCYGIHENTSLWTEDDTAENNQLTGANCLMTKEEAIAHARNLQEAFPEVSYAVKKFLD